jgi:hypothetical protein
MKLRIGILALALGFGPTLTSVMAQESPETAEPAQAEPAKEEPAKEEAAKAVAEAAPAAAAAAAPAAAAAAVAPAGAAAAVAAPAPAAAAAPAAAGVPTGAVAKPAAPPAPKELSSSARALQPLAESYKQAYDDVQKWITQVDSQTSATDENVKKLQAQIQANDDAIKTAKAAGDSSKAKALTKENKQLTSQLNSAKKSSADTDSTLAKEASDRAKKYEAGTNKAISDIKEQAK